jgi:hypothetical protein
MMDEKEAMEFYKLPYMKRLDFTLSLLDERDKIISTKAERIRELEKGASALRELLDLLPEVKP